MSNALDRIADDCDAAAEGFVDYEEDRGLATSCRTAASIVRWVASLPRAERARLMAKVRRVDAMQRLGRRTEEE